MLQSCNLQHTKTWFGPIFYVLLHLSSCFAKIYDWYWTMFLFFLQRSFRVCKRKWWCGPWNCQKVYCIYTVFWKIYWQFLIPYSKDTHWWCNISGIFTFSFIKKTCKIQVLDDIWNRIDHHYTCKVAQLFWTAFMVARLCTSQKIILGMHFWLTTK